MSNRTIKHSSRYTGPSGDSRPAREIFDGIEARAIAGRAMEGALLEALDNAFCSGVFANTRPSDRVDAIKSVFMGWIEGAKEVD